MLPASAALSAEREIVISALDAKKAPIRDLSPSDVVVREDGVAREVLRVRPASEPLTIAVLVDDSTAATPAASDIRTGLQEFFGALQGQHEMALITFGDRSTLLVDYTKDKERLKRAALRIFPRLGAGAYFMDAVADAARGLTKREAKRPVIVAIMTEGIEYSNSTYQLVLRRLYESRAALHVLVLGTGSRADAVQDETRNRNIVLDEGTRGTGGRRDQLLSSLALGPALRELAIELEHQWIVTYGRPDSLLQPERVQVEAKREGLTVRARTRLPESKVIQ